MNVKIVVVFSGGLDSTVLLKTTVDRVGAAQCLAVSFDYGQRHRRELLAAKRIAENLRVRHRMIPIDVGGAAPWFMSGSSQTGGCDVPHGHYAEESMKATVVPNRNMIMLAMALAAAIVEGAEEVAYGAHAGDHAIYPDCRPEFVQAMQAAFVLADWRRVELVAPFISQTKADIVRIGHAAGADLAASFSCYEGRELHCGLCGTCVERKEAFKDAGVLDPTIYSA